MEATTNEALPLAREPERETFRMLGGELSVVGEIAGAAGDVVLLRGRMAPGATVPLHSHSDPESFLVLEGAVDAFADDGRGWRRLEAGRSVTMENGIPHALHAGESGAELLITTNHRLAGFFRAAQDAGSDALDGAPSPLDAIERVRMLSKRYGYWMAAPEVHAAKTGRPDPAK